MNYRFTADPETICKDNNDGTFVFFSSNDEGNYHTISYLAWLAEGNTPEPAPEPEPDPVLTPEQKLEAAGLTVTELRELLNLN
jgi:hypothetical protein